MGYFNDVAAMAEREAAAATVAENKEVAGALKKIEDQYLVATEWLSKVAIPVIDEAEQDLKQRQIRIIQDRRFSQPVPGVTITFQGKSQQTKAAIYVIGNEVKAYIDGGDDGTTAGTLGDVGQEKIRTIIASAIQSLYRKTRTLGLE